MGVSCLQICVGARLITCCEGQSPSLPLIQAFLVTHWAQPAWPSHSLCIHTGITPTWWWWKFWWSVMWPQRSQPLLRWSVRSHLKAKTSFLSLGLITKEEGKFHMNCFLTLILQAWCLTPNSLPQAHPGEDEERRVSRSFPSNCAPYLDPHTLFCHSASRKEPGPLGLHPGRGQQSGNRWGCFWSRPESNGDWWPASVSWEGLERAMAAEQGGGEGVRAPLQGSDWLHVLPPQCFPFHTLHLQPFWWNQSRRVV